MASSERDEQYETALADIITLLGTAPPPLKKLRSLYNLNLGWEYAIFQMDLKISGLVIRLVGLHVTPSLPPRNKETMDIVEAISFREHRFDTISMEIFVSLATDVDLHKAYCKMLVYARRLDRVFVVLKHELCTLNAMANPGTEGEFMGFMAPNVDRAADKFWKDHPLSAAIIWTRARLEHSSSVTPEHFFPERLFQHQLNCEYKYAVLLIMDEHEFFDAMAPWTYPYLETGALSLPRPVWAPSTTILEGYTLEDMAMDDTDVALGDSNNDLDLNVYEWTMENTNADQNMAPPFTILEGYILEDMAIDDADVAMGDSNNNHVGLNVSRWTMEDTSAVQSQLDSNLDFNFSGLTMDEATAALEDAIKNPDFNISQGSTDDTIAALNDAHNNPDPNTSQWLTLNDAHNKLVLNVSGWTMEDTLAALDNAIKIPDPNAFYAALDDARNNLDPNVPGSTIDDTIAVTGDAGNNLHHNVSEWVPDDMIAALDDAHTNPDPNVSAGWMTNDTNAAPGNLDGALDNNVVGWTTNDTNTAPGNLDSVLDTNIVGWTTDNTNAVPGKSDTTLDSNAVGWPMDDPNAFSGYVDSSADPDVAGWNPFVDLDF